MNFLKFPSIENLYNFSSNVLWSLNTDRSTSWVVTEKIDGTNIQIGKDENGKVFFGRRNDILPIGSSFYNFFNNVHKVEAVIESLKPGQVVYGEYFGSKVINRIYYGNDYNFRFFSMRVGTLFLPFKDLKTHFDNNGIEQFLVPIIGIYDTLKEALEVPNNLVTRFRDEKHNDKMEGVVIEPFDQAVCIDQDGTLLKIKNKNDAFLEKTKSKSQKRLDSDNITDNIVAFKDEFDTLININRMFSVFSKEGKPKDNSEAGKYIRWMADDAFEEFKQGKEYELSLLSQKQMRYITSVGKKGYQIFCETLNHEKERES